MNRQQKNVWSTLGTWPCHLATRQSWCVPCGNLQNSSKTPRANYRATTHNADHCSSSRLVLSCCSEETDRNAVSASLHIFENVQTYGAVRIHLMVGTWSRNMKIMFKKNTHSVRREPAPKRHRTNFPERKTHKTVLETQREFAP